MQQEFIIAIYEKEGNKKSLVISINSERIMHS